MSRYLHDAGLETPSPVGDHLAGTGSVVRQDGRQAATTRRSGL
jgi:hypothetical protein